MRTKELLAMPALPVTEQMKKLVREDQLTERKFTTCYGHYTRKCYERYEYLRAVVKDGILKVGLYARKSIAAGSSLPNYEIYISKDEKKHKTYCRESGKWLTGKIDSLPLDRDNGYIYGNTPWSSDSTRKLVNEYLGFNNAETKNAVLQYQNILAGDRLKKKHATELEAIDAVMNLVPEMPKDWEDWIYKSAYSRSQYLMYIPKDKEHTAFCTACGNMVRLKMQPKHLDQMRCPHCGTKAITLSWNKQKVLSDKKHVAIIQELEDKSAYVVRIWFSVIKRRKEGDWKVSNSESGYHECFRIIMDRNFVYRRVYEFTEYKYTGIIRWCYETNKGYYYTGYGASQDCVLYHRNLKRLRASMPALKYIPIEDLFRNNQGCYCMPDRKLAGCKQNPQIEYVIKAGLNNLAWDITDRYQRNCLHTDKKKLWEYMGIRKDQLQMCRKMDISMRELQVLQKANELNITITPEQIRFFTLEIGPDRVNEIFKFRKIAKHMNYLQNLKRQNRHGIADYMDYMEDLRKLRIPPDTDVLFPKNFQSTHERISIQRQEREDRLKKMEIQKKNREFVKLVKAIREIYEAEDGEYKVVLPECKEDFNREGRENHNCVGGSYFDKMLRGDCVVFFLRRTQEPEKSFCTVEMDGSRIRQCRAVRNSEPPEEVREWMAKYAELVGSRIRERDEKQAKKAV